MIINTMLFRFHYQEYNYIYTPPKGVHKTSQSQSTSLVIEPLDYLKGKIDDDMDRHLALNVLTRIFSEMLMSSPTHQPSLLAHSYLLMDSQMHVLLLGICKFRL